jgi:hypothetical protein
MMKKTLIALIAGVSLISCSKNVNSNPPDSSQHQQDPPKEEKGYITGQVTDTKGKPVAGVNVYIDNTIFYNSGIGITTDANGKYKVKGQPGAYRAYAEMTMTFNNHPFKIQFHPDNYDAFSGEDGAVRNFQWKLTGERPFNPGTYYGGYATLSKDPSSDMSDAENIEFTFKPVGNLIDGSTGKTIVKSCGAPYSQSYYYVLDIPIGRYEVSAVYKPTGKTVKLRDGRSFDDAFSETVTLDFWGEDAPLGAPNNMYIEFTDK